MHSVDGLNRQCSVCTEYADADLSIVYNMTFHCTS